MKLLHISDLHLGKTLYNFSLLEDQAYILHQILQIAEDEHPDALLISGDVYDKSIPSGEAVQLFDDFLSKLAERKLPTLIISGNHDSAERLSFGNRLMEQAGIHISPVYDGSVKTVTLADRHGEVRFHLLPFLKPVQVRRVYPEAEIESYTDALRTVVEHMEIDPAVRNVLLTHQFVTGATTCESEERVVGGTDNVDDTVFEAFDYVALGHLHGQQNVGSNRIRYCGTPLKYSVSEEGHRKSVTVVKLEEKGNLHVSLVPLYPKWELRTIKGRFEDILKPENSSEDYMHVVLTDEDEVHEAMGRLRVIFPRLLPLEYDNTRTRSSHVIEDPEDGENRTPLEVLGELYEQQNMQPMSPEQISYCTKVINELEGL